MKGCMGGWKGPTPVRASYSQGCKQGDKGKFLGCWQSWQDNRLSRVWGVGENASSYFFFYVPDPFCAVFRNFLGCSRNFLGCSWGVGIFFRVKMRCSGNIKIVEHTLIFNTLAVKLTNRTYCVGSFMVRVFNRVTIF